MKKLFILICLLLIEIANAGECTSEANCKVLVDKWTGISTSNLECFLNQENITNVKINAYNVLDANGSLKTYFGTGKTVCDVLGWMNKAADNFSKVDGLVASGYNKPIDLFIKPQISKINIR